MQLLTIKLDPFELAQISIIVNKKCFCVRYYPLDFGAILLLVWAEKRAEKNFMQFFTDFHSRFTSG